MAHTVYKVAWSGCAFNYYVIQNGGGGALVSVEEVVFFVLIASKSLNTGSSLPSPKQRNLEKPKLSQPTQKNKTLIKQENIN